MIRKRVAALGAVFAALLLALCLGQATPAHADTQTFEIVSRAITYIRKNKPTDLYLKNVRFKPRELMTIYQEMPEGSSFTFTTNWGGVKLTQDAEELDLREIKVGVTKEDLEAVIALCPNIRKIDNSGKRRPTNEDMIPLMEKYPEIQFEWVVHLGGAHYCATTASAYSTFNQPTKGDKLTAKNMENIKYCYRIKALDLGHNRIESLDWVRYLPDLEFLIAGDNRFSDLTPLGECKHLKYAEIFSNEFTDLTPLANCTELLDLNICNCPVSDLSPVENIASLERLWAPFVRKLPEEEKARFRQVRPDVEVDFSSNGATGHGWRKHDRYKHYIWCLKNATWIPFDEPLPKGKFIKPFTS